MTDQPRRSLLDMQTGAATTNYRARPRHLSREDLKRVGLPESFWRVSLKGVPEAYVQPLKRYMMHTSDDTLCTLLCERVRSGQGLLIYGDPGVGKSSVAALIARRARAWRFTVYFTTATALREGRRGGYLFDSEEDRTVWDRAHEVDLLIMDDVTEQDLADRYYGQEELLSLLRVRAENDKTNIVTTRLPSSHAFVAELQSSVPGMGPFPMRGENRIRQQNADLYADLFG